MKLDRALVGGQRERGSFVSVITGPHCSSPRPILLIPPHLIIVPRSSGNRPCIFCFGSWGQTGPATCLFFSYVISDVCVQIHRLILPYFFFLIILFGFECVGFLLLHGLFSGCSKCGLLCGTQASYYGGFSYCRALALEHRLSSCGPWT